MLEAATAPLLVGERVECLPDLHAAFMAPFAPPTVVLDGFKERAEALLTQGMALSSSSNAVYQCLGRRQALCWYSNGKCMDLHAWE